MAVIEEVTAAYEKARADQEFLDTLDRLQRITAVGRRRCTRRRGSASTRAARGSSSSEKT